MIITTKTATKNNLSIDLRQDKDGFYTVIVSEDGRRIDRKVYGNLKSANTRYNAMKRKYF